ncbi:SRPBCC family protein [Luteimonas wenzhouensis]|uniref:SRPBCC family protein n=1 Tax=Luteimonas wenzhouensis TaxID=2599615 RepID=A0A5C5TXD6_9GAMM|nr:SRPBCC family protein [Luteimonas wenzhouensis]TWT17905.1 SRPBCC family protein [Luteimonas wenzhouensis]
MSDANNNTGTVTLHRVLRAPPERVYRAFVDPAAMAKWSPPHGFTGVVHESDVRVGGGYRMSFTNFSTGTSHTFGGRYVELVEGERIRYTDAFEDPGLPGEMQVTVTFEPSPVGTVLRIRQEGLPEAVPVDFCYAGWQESLELLARLVEPEIPDGA